MSVGSINGSQNQMIGRQRLWREVGAVQELAETVVEATRDRFPELQFPGKRRLLADLEVHVVGYLAAADVYHEKLSLSEQLRVLSGSVARNQTISSDQMLWLLELPSEDPKVDRCVRTFFGSITELRFGCISTNELRFIVERSPNLERLEISNARALSDEDLSLIGQNCQDLETLRLSYCTQVTSVGFQALETFPALRRLKLSSCPNFTDTELATLSQTCSHLEALCLPNCSQITNIGFQVLRRFHALQWLDLSYCGITDLGPVRGLKKLQKLYLPGSQVQDVGPLKSLTNLRELNLTTCKISDLGPLQTLVNLQELYYYDCQAMDLGPLRNLQNLRMLQLSRWQGTDLGPLNGLVNLEELFLLHCPNLTDTSPLNNLRLRTLDLFDCPKLPPPLLKLNIDKD